MRPRTLFVFLASWLVTAPLGAQYIAPGTSTSGGDFPDEDRLRTSLEEARWRLGVVRVDPWIGVRDAAFVTSSTTDREDVTVTFGAGLRGYLKTGRRLIWAAHAMPEYVWWEDDEDKRTLNGRYGLGLFAYFNRLGLELSIRRQEQQGFFSSEIQELTSTKSEAARFHFELDLTNRLIFYGDYSFIETLGEEDGTIFTSLDRDTESTQVGLRYESPRNWWISAGIEDSAEDFAENARNLSNTTDAGLFGLGYEGSRFSLATSLELRSSEPREGSEFVDLDTTTGYVETLWGLHRSVDLMVYGRRQIGYSVVDVNSNILADRLGLRFGFRLRGSTLGLVAELGEDDYRPTADSSIDRLDDLASFGATLSFSLRSIFTVNLGILHTEYDSNLPSFNRDVTAWTVTIQLAALRDRLRLGEGDKIW